MTGFRTNPETINWLVRKLNELESRVNRFSQGSRIRGDSTPPVGIILPHAHQGGGDGGFLDFVSFSFAQMASSTPAGVRRLYTQTGVAGNTLAILDGDNVTERRIEVRRQATPPVGATGFHGDPAFDYTARQFWVKDDVGSSTWTLIGPADSVRVFNSAAITLTTTTVTALTFDSERWDTNTMHSTSSNTDRLTAKVAGKYLVQGYAGFSANAAGERQLRIDKNNTSIEAAEQRSAVGAGATEYMVVSALVDMAVNDYVQLKAYQTSGGNLNVVAQAEVSPQFSMQGPF